MLLRAVTIVDPESPHNGRMVDVRIQEGRITGIADKVGVEQEEEIIEGEGYCVAPGFVDIGAYLGEPGLEERNDRADLRAAARAGGYVTVAVLPGAGAARQSVADLDFVRQGNEGSGVDLLPLGAISKDLMGKDLTGMLELADRGAVGFTDGPHRGTSASLVKRALEYAKAADTTIFITPTDRELAAEGQLHEGLVSTRLGLPGVPRFCETIPLRRNLELREYTGGKLVFHLITTAESVEILGAPAGARVPATVSAHHLTFTDEALGDFGTNHKIYPPLREETDRRALVAALATGTIDAVVSHHQPRHREEKDMEFPYAAFGARGLETAFRQLLALSGEELSLERIVSALSHGPRRLLAQVPQTIAVNQPARLTIFTQEGGSEITPQTLRGKTLNSPLLGKNLPGRIVGTVNHRRFFPA